MSQNFYTPSTAPLPPPFQPAYLGGGGPQFQSPLKSSQTFHDYSNNYLPADAGVNRRPSNSSGSVRVTTPRYAAPGHSLNEHKNFREVSDYMSTDTDCIVIRRFGVLRFRDMLCKQAQVAEVERKLAEADYKLLRGIDEPNLEEMKQLMEELDTKLKAYDGAVDRCHKAYTMPRPSDRIINKTKTWMTTRQIGYFPQEQEKDLITLDSSLVTDGPITRAAARIARVIFKNEVTTKAGVHQLSTDRAIQVSRTLISLIAPVILLVPIVLLCYVKTLLLQIVIVALATVISSFIMMLAKVGNSEVFMATSAYAAVMVVFLGSVANVGGGNGIGSKSG
ncbi:hypothetical protein L873DRAFT_1806511 [Choiromyces venosus 120613-1]|uniref:DUF6594 domain-containing protein n=1 Tax=Choiromyces venosus 120613-1 TaxID=1336337 RepID=A0A3N4JN09_9PEZI|nr:hypothetical protein L873DRAFT_1806511 [Choiromyces venosus 120613-1]